MFPLAFVAGWLQGHWWGFISRNYVVWPTFLLKNVFTALKGSHFRFLIGVVWGLGGDTWSSAVWVHPQLSLHYPNTRHTPPHPTHSPSHTLTQPIYPTTTSHHSSYPHPSRPYMPIPLQRLPSVLTRRICHYGGFVVPWLLNTNVKHRI